MFNSTDLFLLNKFQRMSDWFQDLFGADNFKISKILRNIYILLYILKLIFDFSVGKVFFDIFMFILDGIIIILVPSLFIYFGEQFCRSNPSFQNPMVKELRAVRIVCIVFFVLSIPTLPLHIINSINYTDVPKEFYKEIKLAFVDLKYIILGLLVYFGCCTPKPRKPSKIKKFQQKIIDEINNLKERASLPNPVLAPAHARN